MIDVTGLPDGPEATTVELEGPPGDAAKGVTVVNAEPEGPVITTGDGNTLDSIETEASGTGAIEVIGVPAGPVTTIVEPAPTPEPLLAVEGTSGTAVVTGVPPGGDTTTYVLPLAKAETVDAEGEPTLV